MGERITIYTRLNSFYNNEMVVVDLVELGVLGTTRIPGENDLRETATTSCNGERMRGGDRKGEEGGG